jgi:hypothetical protein
VRADGDTTRACIRPRNPVRTVIFSDVRQTPDRCLGCPPGVWNPPRSRLHTVVAFRPARRPSAATIADMPEPRPGDPPLPDRYADAVRARRAELRGVRTLLLGGHRVEVRHCLTASQLVAVAELAAALSVFGRELRHHAARADRAGRAALPLLADAAVGRLVDRVVMRWAAVVLPGLRRVAAPLAPDAVPVLR